jgi:hypothetical protein
MKGVSILYNLINHITYTVQSTLTVFYILYTAILKQALLLYLMCTFTNEKSLTWFDDMHE